MLTMDSESDVYFRKWSPQIIRSPTNRIWCGFGDGWLAVNWSRHLMEDLAFNCGMQLRYWLEFSGKIANGVLTIYT